MASHEAIARTLAILAASHGLELTDLAAEVWHAALEDLSDQDVARGAELVARHHRHGRPAPAHVRAAVVGVPVRVPRHATDNYGRRVLGPDGEPRVDRWETAFVPLDQRVPLDAQEAEQRGLLSPQTGTPLLEGRPDPKRTPGRPEGLSRAVFQLPPLDVES